jgi:hypothetical protein
MTQPWIDFGTGLLTGGLSLSACWGLFWLVIGAVGFRRGTCSRQVLLSALAASGVPLSMLAALVWWRGAAQGPGLEFIGGLSVVPLVLAGFGLRRAPDGQLAGAHMVAGVRHLMEKLLGKHQACEGCSGEHGCGSGGCG